MSITSKAGEIRRLVSTSAVVGGTQLSSTKLHEIIKNLPLPPEAENHMSLDLFLRAADTLPSQEEDRKNNNATPELFSTPLPAQLQNSSALSGLPPKPPKNFSKSVKKNEPEVFPSVGQMMSIPNVSPSICSGFDNIYQFVGANVPITPKTKAPRTLKPGEVVFSQTGSPIHVPAFPNTEQFPCTPGNNAAGVRPIRLQVPDPKGAFEVDLVFHGDPEGPGVGKMAQVFKGFVTDVRGLITTRSTVRASKRLEIRVPVKSKSAVKKMPWQ
jgi:hypothetical protein